MIRMTTSSTLMSRRRRNSWTRARSRCRASTGVEALRAWARLSRARMIFKPVLRAARSRLISELFWSREGRISPIFQKKYRVTSGRFRRTKMQLLCRLLFLIRSSPYCHKLLEAWWSSNRKEGSNLAIISVNTLKWWNWIDKRDRPFKTDTSGKLKRTSPSSWTTSTWNWWGIRPFCLANIATKSKTDSSQSRKLKWEQPSLEHSWTVWFRPTQPRRTPSGPQKTCWWPMVPTRW